MPVCPGGAVPTRSLADPPSALKDIRIIEADYGKRVIGVMSARRGRLLTAVLACRVLAFSLLDPDAQERRLARWGLVLSGAAGTPIRRIQWIERTAPAPQRDLQRRCAAFPSRSAPC